MTHDVRRFLGELPPLAFKLPEGVTVQIPMPDRIHVVPARPSDTTGALAFARDLLDRLRGFPRCTVEVVAPEYDPSQGSREG